MARYPADALALTLHQLHEADVALPVPSWLRLAETVCARDLGVRSGKNSGARRWSALAVPTGPDTVKGVEHLKHHLAVLALEVFD